MKVSTPKRRAVPPACRSRLGFSLVEVLVATAVMTVGLFAIARLFLIAVDANRWSATVTAAASLAGQKLEQLQSLAYYVDEAGAPVTDGATNLSVDPPAAGGPGLQVSPASALTTTTPGYVDYLDSHGRWVGNGASAPRDAVFVRRWSVTASAAWPNDVLILQVAVARVSAASTGSSRRAGDAVVVGLKARRQR